MLRNQRRERFAQLLASGKTATDAYEEAGYKRSHSNGPALAKSEEIEEARQAAMEAGQYSAAVSAAKEIAVLLGIRIERSERGAPGEFDWFDRLNLEELRALAKGELDVEAYRKDTRTVN
jgi:phage terminase small subunit